jgi:hypothetical protein
MTCPGSKDSCFTAFAIASSSLAFKEAKIGTDAKAAPPAPAFSFISGRQYEPLPI